MSEQKQKSAVSDLSEAQKKELVEAYKEAYMKARGELLQQPPPPQPPGVPAGQGYRLGTDEEIGQKLTSQNVTTPEQAEQLAQEAVYQDAGLPPPAPAAKQTSAAKSSSASAPSSASTST